MQEEKQKRTNGMLRKLAAAADIAWDSEASEEDKEDIKIKNKIKHNNAKKKLQQVNTTSIYTPETAAAAAAAAAVYLFIYLFVCLFSYLFIYLFV